MNDRARMICGIAVVALMLLVCIVFPALKGTDHVILAQTTPQAELTFVGTGKCAPCHFSQFQQWKQDRHAKAFEILPAKYKQDASCLKCHVTGHGQATGFQGESTPGLAGATCEACHGPGSEHVAVAQKLVDVELTPESEKSLRESIMKVKPDNACVQCHLNKAHKDPHPEYDKE
jgi:hypothetical protein